MHWNTLRTLPRAYPGAEALPSFVLYHMGTRSFEQFCCTLHSTIDPYRFCPFCNNERARRGREPTDQEDGWLLLRNEFPHKRTKQMWLIVPCRHITQMAELEFRDWRAISQLMERCLKGQEIRGGGVMWRFGDPHLNAGTVEHLHINIIEPICGEEYRPPLAKTETEHAEDYARVLRFCEMLDAKGGESWLLSPEGIAATQPALS